MKREVSLSFACCFFLLCITLSPFVMYGQSESDNANIGVKDSSQIYRGRGARYLRQQAKAERESFDRGVETIKFVPKGQWITGGSFSYSENTADDYEWLVLKNIEGTNYSFHVSPYIGYFIGDNICVGGRFTYSRSMIKLKSLSLNLSEDLDFSIDDFYNLQHIYSGSAFFRNYVSLGHSLRFAVFNEVRLTLGGGQGKQFSGLGTDLKGTYQDIFTMELGVIPGITAFISNEVAIEASVNVLGFSYKKYTQERNRVETASFEHSGVNFKVDILSINIGVSFYINHINPIRPIFKKGKKSRKTQLE